MPNLRIRRSRAARRSPAVSTPSIRIEPESAVSSPMMHLISTDLPVPEPPIITRLSPARQAISTPSSTSLRPNDLRSPDIAIFGAPSLMMPRSLREESLRQQIVEHQDQDRGRDDGLRRRLTDPFGAAARVIAVIAAHQRDDKAEHRRLDQTGNDVHRFEIALGLRQVADGVEVQ